LSNNHSLALGRRVNNLRTIKPMYGFGDLRFGVSQAEARAYFGDPETQQYGSIKGVPDDHYETWYWASGLSAGFLGEDHVLAYFSSQKSDSELFNQRIVGMKFDFAFKLVDKHVDDDKAIEQTQDQNEAGDFVATYMESRLRLYVFGGRVASIDWWAPFADVGELSKTS
jgi:hypothetical protein